VSESLSASFIIPNPGPAPHLTRTSVGKTLTKAPESKNKALFAWTTKSNATQYGRHLADVQSGRLSNFAPSLDIMPDDVSEVFENDENDEDDEPSTPVLSRSAAKRKEPARSSPATSSTKRKKTALRGLNASPIKKKKGKPQSSGTTAPTSARSLRSGRDVVVFTPDVPSVTATPGFSAANDAEEVGFGNVVGGDAEVVSSGVSSSEEDDDGSTADVAGDVAPVTPAPQKLGWFSWLTSPLP
jgi:hypothetical protein